ncbi:hypothetical protein DEU38_101338 [Rhodococcus sp. AG1013]|nr:hypothetical protein DEU38_101338 [Rhodococcus sp. AG1013]
MSIAVLLLFGCITGITTVAFGFGGGFVTVPVVYWFIGRSATAPADTAMHVAVATSAAVMVVNATIATYTYRRNGGRRLAGTATLLPALAIGGLLGALLATRVDGAVVHAFFVVYLVATVVDVSVRRGFLAAPATYRRSPGGAATTIGGVAVGSVASFLGVGGSVMTVPILRRRGMSMIDATGLANLLTLPVALAASVIYATTGPAAVASATGLRVGLVDVAAAGALLAGALPAIAIVRRSIGRIPDRAHAVGYIGLLVLVAALMTALR